LIPPARAFLLIRFAVLSVLLVVISQTRADPDLWGHITFGGDTAQARGIVRVDPYSFTSDIPWTNHEWLSELVTWLAWAAAGAAGVVLLKLLLLSTSLSVVLASIHRSLYGAPALELTMLFFAFGTRRQAATVRPQLFSLALFALLLLVLRRADSGRWRGLLAVPVLLALWANLHGGWIVGLGTFGLWALFRFVSPASNSAERVRLVAIVMVSLLATLLTPYGTEMWSFLRETVSPVRTDIQDWQPAWALEPAVLALWLAMAGGAVVYLVKCPGPRPPGHYAIVAFFAVASLWVNRLDGFFALSVLILLPVHRIARRQPASGVPNASVVSATRAQAIVVGGLAAAGIAAALFLTGRNLRCITMDEPWLPEPEAAHFIQQQRLDGRLLVWFDWGEYAIWHFVPHLRVSMDGRRETVYSVEMQDAHTRFYYDQPSASTLPDRTGADYIWMPKHFPIVSTMAAQGWHVAFEGAVSALLSRTPLPRLLPDRANQTERRCFPGP
jgi:hypothetical protein